MRFLRISVKCPIRVKRVGFVMSAVCPVYPQQQTSPDKVGTSHCANARHHAGSSDDRGPNPMGGCIMDYLPYRGAPICYCFNIGNAASDWELLCADGTSSRLSAGPVTTHLIT